MIILRLDEDDRPEALPNWVFRGWIKIIVLRLETHIIQILDTGDCPEAGAQRIVQRLDTVDGHDVRFDPKAVGSVLKLVQLKVQ
jgi:hypothetical protein